MGPTGESKFGQTTRRRQDTQARRVWKDALRSEENLRTVDRDRQHQTLWPPGPAILLTLGDPNGLGPELTCRVLSSAQPVPAKILIIGPEEALLHHAHALGTPPFWRTLSDACSLPLLRPGIYHINPSGPARFTMQPGRAAKEGGRAAGISLDLACDLLARGAAQALVTCPLNKAMLQQAGFRFAGHTEFLASRCGLETEDVCMHFWGPRLRVSLVTTHPPLDLVSELISESMILRKLELTLGLLHALGRDRPVAVCGLNPHAGEDGFIGDEEARFIAPAVNRAKMMGWNVVGPLAADTIFRRALLGEFSAVLAMYHDQGLGPFKLLHFNSGIQITLGLPYIRTSPDHGTGYDLVGTGKASPRSLQTALDMAVKLAGLAAP